MGKITVMTRRAAMGGVGKFHVRKRLEYMTAQHFLKFQTNENLRGQNWKNGQKYLLHIITQGRLNSF